jgi:hypothetical protein
MTGIGLDYRRSISQSKSDIGYNNGMTQKANYLFLLQSAENFEAFLLEHSNLPGPRSNLELADVAARLATPAQIEHLLAYPPQPTQEQSAEEFLPVCGTIALGYELVRGKEEAIPLLYRQANDPRWRVRESVAIALQVFGDANLAAMFQIAHGLAKGSAYEQRAAAAAVCEPRLLVKPEYASAALDILDQITQAICKREDRKSDAFKTLRKGLAYCWSVAVAALPAEGKPRFAAWAHSSDRDIRWLLGENLKKNRLLRMDPAWTKEMTALIGKNPV